MKSLGICLGASDRFHGPGRPGKHIRYGTAKSHRFSRHPHDGNPKKTLVWALKQPGPDILPQDRRYRQKIP